MEGVLTRVSLGQSEKLKRRWCILSGTGELTLYRLSDRSDFPSYEVTSVKGKIVVRSCNITVSDASKHEFQIRHPCVERFICFRAPSDESMDAWVRALCTAAENADPGDLDDFDNAMPLHTDRSERDSPQPEQLNSIAPAIFEVMLEKTKEYGFGMVIEATPEGISVKAVNEGLTVLSIIPESAGTLQVGDRLLKIGDQDVHDWSIASIIELIQRLPAQSCNCFSFTRKNVPVPPLQKRSFHLTELSRLKSTRTISSPNTPRDMATPREVLFSPRELFAQYNVLECGMCIESFEESGDRCPHVLSCGHSFCYKDLKTLLKVVSDTFRCPTCLHKSKLSQYDGKFPPKNFSMLEALRFEYKAGEATNNAKNAAPEEGGCSGCGEENLLVHCYDCNADFCSKCNITIHQPVKFKAHYRGAVEAPEAVSSVCSVHNEKLKVYCFSQSCQTPICVLCTTIGTHKSHEFRPIQDVFIQAKEVFKTRLNEEVSILQALEQYNLEKSGGLSALSQNVCDSQRFIQEDFSAARQQLDELEKHAIDSLNAYAETASAPLKSDLAKINQCLHDAVSKKNSKLLFASSIRFMSELAAADKQMNNTYQTATSILADLRAEDVQHPLGIRIIGRDPRGITIQNADYKFLASPEMIRESSNKGNSPKSMDKNLSSIFQEHKK